MRRDEWMQQKLFRTIGIASVLAALCAVVGDELAQYSPQGYASLPTVERALPFWRLLSGELLGVLGVPLCLLGYWCVCQAIGPRGRKGTSFIFWLIAFGLVMGVVSHAIISSAYMVMQVGDLSLTSDITNRLQIAGDFPGVLFLLSYLIVSVWYVVVVITGRTSYPRWMALFNPFLLSLLIALLGTTNVLPAVTNLLWPAWLSIPHLLFFILSLLFLWNTEQQI